jgi:hypothetical protein
MYWVNMTLNINKPKRMPIANCVAFRSITSLALGTYYLISSYQRDTAIMVSSVPSRLVAAWIMYRNGGNWTQVAAFETSMAVVASAALIWDRYM